MLVDLEHVYNPIYKEPGLVQIKKLKFHLISRLRIHALKAFVHLTNVDRTNPALTQLRHGTRRRFAKRDASKRRRCFDDKPIDPVQVLKRIAISTSDSDLTPSRIEEIR